MSKLDELKSIAGLFLDKIPSRPQGRYTHFILLRETESFPVFQTDGTLNTITVQAGLSNSDKISRLVMFKRKQSSPERLMGRELLRFYKLITDVGDQACVYNAPKGGACKACPDCILYGYAIGEQGAEKSKVLVDSTFSITQYEDSHKSFIFNAPYENGTMTEKGITKSSFGEQDHIVPQVFFPSVVTLKDPTYEGFVYVLGNILRTDRYGAQETRTGKVFNHVVAITFTNGEIFSNLRLSQAMYDYLKNRDELSHPLDRAISLESTISVYRVLIPMEPVAVLREIVGYDLIKLLDDVKTVYQDSEKTKNLLTKLYADTESYARQHGARQEKKKDNGKGKSEKSRASKTAGEVKQDVEEKEKALEDS